MTWLTNLFIRKPKEEPKKEVEPAALAAPESKEKPPMSWAPERTVDDNAWTSILAQIDPELWTTLPSYDKFLELHTLYNKTFAEESSILLKDAMVHPQLAMDLQNKFVHRMKNALRKMVSELKSSERKDNFVPAKDLLTKKNSWPTLFAGEQFPGHAVRPIDKDKRFNAEPWYDLAKKDLKEKESE